MAQSSSTTQGSPLFVIARDDLLRGPFCDSDGGGQYAAYVVFNGRAMGVFQSWAAAGAATTGFSNAIYKGYNTVRSARVAWDTALATGCWGLMHEKFGIERHPPMQPFEGFLVSDSVTDSGSRTLRNLATPLRQPASNSPDKADAAATVTKSNEHLSDRPSENVGNKGPPREHNVRMDHIRAGLAARSAERVGPTAPDRRERRSGNAPFHVRYPSNLQHATTSVRVPVQSASGGHDQYTFQYLSPSGSVEAMYSQFARPAHLPRDVRAPSNLPRSGIGYGSHHTLPSDRPPPVPLGADQLWYVVVVGRQPGVYQGSVAAEEALGSSNLARLVMGSNYVHALHIYTQSVERGDVLVLEN